MQGDFSLHGREMDELAPKHSRVKLSVTEGLSESNDRETGRLVKWPAIHYQLAAQHKINRALGILNEPASLGEIARVQPQPRCTALEGILKRWLLPRLQPMQDSGWVLCRLRHRDSRTKENTPRRNIPSLTCHFNPLLKPLPALVFCLSLSICLSPLSFCGCASWGSDICLLSRDAKDLRRDGACVSSACRFRLIGGDWLYLRRRLRLHQGSDGQKL